MVATGARAFTPRRWWTGPFDVEQLAWSAVTRARDAAAELAAARGLALTVDTTADLVAASFSAIEHLRIDGRVPQAWGELSGFVEARDGWVRLHGNYPHHAEVLRRVFGVHDRSSLQREVARRDAAEIEDEVTAAGGIAARVRTCQEWAAHPQDRAQQDAEWVNITQRGQRPALPPAASSSTNSAPNLLAGVRVLDLTRVIAGPSGTQLLACLGADVLRIDPPHRPELADQHLSAGMGKRSALLDLRRDPDQFQTLAAGADVIVCGYRPGALDALGLGIEVLEQLAPRAVIVSLSAWGETGPWGHRAGFDSIVQAATGIATECGADGRPGALPVQALDHATGQLLAAHVLESLARARASTQRLSLLGAARALLAMPSPPVEAPETLEVPRARVTAAGKVLDAVPPPLRVEGVSIERPVGEYGAAELCWQL
ncbi:CoA transferase [uncultured Brachybacterium sp.]|uniref:CoA transferase n=1 Tax=uncultured Brachybacterium sp. TaxID=189680 RepID=UPI0026198175|nr:CoA transferase [uncultured Brachybacterium sp.]